MLNASLEIPLVDFRGHAATNGVRQSRQTDADPDTHVLDVWNLKRSIAEDVPAANCDEPLWPVRAAIPESFVFLNTDSVRSN